LERVNLLSILIYFSVCFWKRISNGIKASLLIAYAYTFSSLEICTQAMSIFKIKVLNFNSLHQKFYVEFMVF
jgi:hypothetical protein